MTMTKPKTLKTNLDSQLFNLLTEEYAEQVLSDGYAEGIRGYPFEEMMLNGYTMEYRWAYKEGFERGLEQHKRNILEGIVLGHADK